MLNELMGVWATIGSGWVCWLNVGVCNPRSECEDAKVNRFDLGTEPPPRMSIIEGVAFGLA